MKKIIIIIVALFYLAVSSGFIVHMHFCMGQLADWSLGQNKSKICSKCGMKESDEKDNGCCRDEYKFIKNNTDQKITQTGFQLIKLTAVSLPVFFVEILPVSFPSRTKENSISNALPRSHGVAVYIRNCVFLI